MPVFITLTDENSTINASGLSSDIQNTLTGSSISFTNTTTGVVTTYSDANLLGGSFSQFVQFTGNNANNEVLGSVGSNGLAILEGRETTLLSTMVVFWVLVCSGRRGFIGLLH